MQTNICCRWVTHMSNWPHQHATITHQSFMHHYYSPSAASVLQQLIPSSFDLTRFSIYVQCLIYVLADIDGLYGRHVAGFIQVKMGFEISVPRTTYREENLILWHTAQCKNWTIPATMKWKPAGLGVRDSLRYRSWLVFVWTWYDGGYYNLLKLVL